MEVSVTNDELGPRTVRKKWLGSSASNPAMHAAIASCLLAGLLLFYSNIYLIHQDLAGSALSGRLSMTLGDSFRNYSIYFPPAERFWFSLAVYLTDLTGLRLDLMVVLLTGVAVLFSTGLAYRIRQVTVGASPLFLLLSVAVLVILPITFKNVFGLREHMVALGMWPYLVLRVSDPHGKRIGWQTRTMLGLWLGVMLLFKYLYSIVVFLVELADAIVQRRPRALFRIENIVAGGVVVLYLFIWLGLDSSQREGISAVFSAIDAALADPKTNWVEATKNLIAAIFFLLAFWVFEQTGREAALGFALVVGAVIVAFVQERWFSHHLFAISMAYIGWWWMAGRGFKWWAHGAVALYMLFGTVTQYVYTRSYQEKVGELSLALDEAGASVAGKRVGILTMHPNPYNEYLASHGAIRWNASMNNAYVASELEPFDKPENAHIPPPPVELDNPGRRILHDEMLRLWEDMPPDVLILDHSYRWPLRYIDVEWTHVFSQDPRFNAVLKQYRPVLTHHGKRLEFKYYVRAE